MQQKIIKIIKSFEYNLKGYIIDFEALSKPERVEVEEDDNTFFY